MIIGLFIPHGGDAGKNFLNFDFLFLLEKLATVDGIVIAMDVTYRFFGLFYSFLKIITASDSSIKQCSWIFIKTGIETSESAVDASAMEVFML